MNFTRARDRSETAGSASRATMFKTSRAHPRPRSALEDPETRLATDCSICESHDECQSDVESRDIAVIEVTDLPRDSCAPNRDRFVGNHMRPRAMGKTPSVTRYSVTRYEESQGRLFGIARYGASKGVTMKHVPAGGKLAGKSVSRAQGFPYLS
jgi:hypothetical protein